MTAHTIRTLAALAAALFGAALSPAQTSARGFQLTTEVSTTPGGPSGPSATVPMFEPVFFRFTLTRVSGSSLEVLELGQEHNYLVLFIKGASEPDEAFENVRASTWVANCTHHEPVEFLPGQTMEEVSLLAERIDSDGVTSYFVEAPGVYTVASGYIDYDPNGLEIQAEDVTINVLPPRPGMRELVGQGLLSHLQGSAKADGEGLTQRLALEPGLARFADRPFVSTLRATWERMWPVGESPVDEALLRALGPKIQSAMAAYLAVDLGALTRLLALEATYNVVIGREEFLRLVPAIRANAAAGTAWMLTSLKREEEGRPVAIVEVGDSRGALVQRWELTWSKDGSALVSWKAQ